MAIKLGQDKITRGTIIARPAHIVSVPLLDGAAVMDVETGRYFSLNQTAAAVWQCLETPMSVGDVCARLQSAFSVSQDECAAAVVKLVQALADRQVLQLNAIG